VEALELGGGELEDRAGLEEVAPYWMDWDLPGVEAALPEGDGELGHASGGFGGDGLGGRARLELLRGVEDGAEDLEVPGLAERLERDLVDLLAGGGEVRVDDDPGEVAGDEERRVLEGGAVLVELEVGTSAQPSEPSFLVAPFSKVKRSPVGSTSACLSDRPSG
jgi:hypothetical protein